MRKCKRCGELKQPCEFYAHSKMPDGLFAECKVCVRTERHEYYLAKKAELKEMYAERHRRRQAEGYYDTYRRAPGKVAAQRAVSAAKKSGRLIPQPCQVCGAKKVDAHHPDYEKPLEVVWLCRKHHMELHRMEPPEWARKVG